MSWWNDLRQFLNGKKAIITSIVAGVDYVGTNEGWWEADTLRTGMEIVFWGIFMRLGIQKSGPVVQPAAQPVQPH